MTDVQITVIGLDEVIRAMGDAGHILDEELERAANRSVALLAGEIERRAPYDSGTLAKSIVSEVRPAVGGVTGLVTVQASHARAVEYGRKPGKMPPVDALRPWARRHGIPDEAVFAIARAIGRRGTKPQPYFEPAIEAMTGEIQREFQQAVDRALARIGGQ